MQGLSLGQRFLTAKLAGQRSASDEKPSFEYRFRSNEDAARIACAETAAWLIQRAQHYRESADAASDEPTVRAVLLIKAELLYDLGLEVGA